MLQQAEIDSSPAQEIIGGKSFDVTTDPQNVEQRDNARFENNLNLEKKKKKINLLQQIILLNDMFQVI